MRAEQPLPAPLESIRERFAMVDALALDYKPWVIGTLKILFLLVFVAALMFDLFAHGVVPYRVMLLLYMALLGVAYAWGVEKSSFSAVIGLAELEKSVALSPEMEGALFHGWSRIWQRARRQARRNQHRIAAPGGYSRGCSRRAGIAGRRSTRSCRSGSKPSARSCGICDGRAIDGSAKADALKRQVDELRAEMQRRAEQSPPR